MATLLKLGGHRAVVTCAMPTRAAPDSKMVLCREGGGGGGTRMD